MSECKWAVLPERRLLRISGSDAETFLQGIVTSDMSLVSRQGALFAGLLSPQGKILFDFFIVADNKDFLIDVDEARANDLAKRLTFYKLRADVAVTAVGDGVAIAACWDGDTDAGNEGVSSFVDPRHPDLGRRVFMSDGKHPGGQKVEEDCYHAHRIGLGVAEGGRDYSFEAVFPHDANFDLIGGVDFAKGCFVGQEVVSRMEHRGNVRKRVVKVAALDGRLHKGAEIKADGHSLGVVGSVAGAHGLAIVRLDRAIDALKHGLAILAGDSAVQLRSPPYADLGLPT